MKKNLLSVLIITLITMALMLYSCSEEQVTTTPPVTEFTYNVADIADFSIDIVYGQTTYNFDRTDLAGLTIKDFSTSTIKDNVTTAADWKGVALSDLLAAANITVAVTKIGFSNADGTYTSEYTLNNDIANFYIAIFEKADGNYVPCTLDYVRNICSADSAKSNWIKSLAKITINPVALAAANTFSIVVSKLEDSVTINNASLSTLTLSDITTSTIKNEVTTVTDWKGISLSEILADAGITDTVTAIIFSESLTPYSSSYTTIVDIDNFYIVLYEKVDGVYVPLASSDIKNVSTDDTSRDTWVNGLENIIINPTD